jgi:ArsR family transcriptional regulator
LPRHIDTCQYHGVNILDISGCCAPVARSTLSEPDAELLATVFKALADPVRLRLLNMISTSPTGEVCACDLVAPTGRSQPTVSHHLKVLREAGLLTADKRGSWVWYAVAPDRLAELRSALGPAELPGAVGSAE